MEVVGSLDSRKIWKRIRQHAAHGKPPDGPAWTYSLKGSQLSHASEDGHCVSDRTDNTMRLPTFLRAHSHQGLLAALNNPAQLTFWQLFMILASSYAVQAVFLTHLDVMPAALAELKQGLRGAELVQLAAGEVHVQQSSWVLLKGTLRITGHAAFVPAGMPGVVTISRLGCLTVDIVCWASKRFAALHNDFGTRWQFYVLLHHVLRCGMLTNGL